MLLQGNLDKHIRLVVVQPNYYQQRLLLAQFVFDAKAVYLRCDDGLEQAEILKQIEAALDNTPRQNITYIILDECDRVQPQTLDMVIIDLLRMLPSARMVLFSRYLPQIILDNSDIRAITQIIPRNNGGWQNDPLNHEVDSNKPRLEVHAFGQGRVYFNSKEITEWNGQLSRNLFFYLIDNPIITRDMIFQTFWPDMPVNDATNVFHVTKGNIQKALGFDLFTFSRRYYRLKDSVDLHYDVLAFHEMSQEGMLTRDEGLLQTAYQLFKYPFLQGTLMSWVETRREELELQYSDSMSVLADHKLAAGDLDAALGLNIRIWSINRKREDLAERIMRLYIQRNQPCDALEIFNETAQFLLTTIGTEPDRPLQQAAVEARRLCEQQGVE
jgi:DNA-binding SARP family transcriptional activator